VLQASKVAFLILRSALVLVVLLMISVVVMVAVGVMMAAFVVMLTTLILRLMATCIALGHMPGHLFPPNPRNQNPEQARSQETGRLASVTNDGVMGFLAAGADPFCCRYPAGWGSCGALMKA
jgi:hypothetical protein